MSGTSSDDGRLHGSLGLLDAVLLSVGGMVGSAIFYFPGATGRSIGPASILAWLAMGLLMIPVGLLYAELALAFPEAGGPAVYPYETLGSHRTVRSFASYLEGVAYSFGWTIAITVSALAIAGYLGIVFPAATGYTVPIALLAIVGSLGVNLVGVRLTSRANLLLAAALLAVLLTFVAAGLAHAAPTNYRPFFTGDGGSFFAAMGIAMMGYGAWTAIPAAAEEIENPARTVPRAIVLSLGITILLYAAVLVALHGVLGPGAFAQQAVLYAPLGVAATTIGMPIVANVLVPLGAIVAIFTTMLVGTMSASRVLLAMGRRGGVPEVFARVHPRFEVPWVGLVFVSAVAAALALEPDYFHALETVASLVGTAIPYAINILAFVGLRTYRTDVDPAFRAPGGLALAAVAGVAVLVVIVNLGLTEVVWSVGALAIIAGYYLLRQFHVGDAEMLPTD